MLCQACKSEVMLDDMVIVIEDQPGTTNQFKVYKCPACKYPLAVFPIDSQNPLIKKLNDFRNKLVDYSNPGVDN